MSLRKISMTRGRAGGVVAVALAVGIALAGCTSAKTSGSSATTGGQQGGTLTIAATYGPTSLDPALQSVDAVNNWYVNLAYDTLTRLDGNGNPVPDLATSWKYTDSTNTTFELTLRKGIKFSDGTAITAADVAQSLTYSRTKGVNGPNWLAAVNSITAPDASTVKITTSQPDDSLPIVLSQRLLLGSIINPKGLADPAALKSQSFGAGPYVLDASQTIADDTYVYTPNKNYWDPSKIHWKKVVIKVVASTAAALQAVENGEADLFSGDAATGAAAKAAGLNVTTAPFGETGINIVDRNGTIVPALKDVRVRQALLYAIDGPTIAQAVFNGFATPGESIVRKDFTGYSAANDTAYSYDIAKAKSLLAAAGYPNGFSFTMCAPAPTNTNLMAQAVIQDWAKIGVRVKLTTYTDLGQMTTDILAKKYPVTAFIYGALPTYIEMKSFFTGGATQFNPFNTQDSTLTQEIATAAASSGTAQDTAYQAVIQRALVTDAWVSNVYTRQQISIYDKKITGISISSPNPTPDIAWTVVPAN